MEEKELGFFDFFKEVPDHRIERGKRHSVSEILFLTFCGVVQHKIVEKIIEKKADYLIGLKGNQRTLNEENGWMGRFFFRTNLSG